MADTEDRDKAHQEQRALAVECLPDGRKRSRDPRRMSTDLLNRIGHEKMPLLKVIRAECLACSGRSLAEARRCTAVDCALWPYRAGTNPFSERKGNPKAIAALRAARKAKDTKG
jgi:hypothetical protein